MTNDASLESYYALLLESAKKLQAYKSLFFLPNLVIYSKMYAKMYKKLLNIHFLKALEHAISNMQKCLLDFL